MKYPSNMDKEIIELCDLINSYNGMQTFESCCGHGEDRIRIWFRVWDMDVVSEFSKDMHDYRDFYIEYWCGDFIFTSENKGEIAYEQGRKLAKIFEWRKNETIILPRM